MVTRKQVVELIVDRLGVEPKKVTDDALISDDLGADSLDKVELVMALEEQLGVEMKDEDAEKMSTVGDILKYLEEHGQLS